MGRQLTLKERLTGKLNAPSDVRMPTADSGWDQLLYLIGELKGNVTYEKVKDVESAIATSPVASRAVHIISDTISLLPMQVWKDGEYVENPDPALASLLQKPNLQDPSMTTRKFLEQVMIDYMTFGRLCIFFESSGRKGQVVKYTRLAAKNLDIEVVTDASKRKTFDAFEPPIIGIKYNKTDLPLEQVIYIYNWTARSEYKGESPLQAALDNAAGNAAMVRSMRSLFEKNGLPSVQMLVEQGFNITTDKQNELVQEWRKRYQNPDNRGGIVTPPPGIRFEPLQVTNKDAEYSLTLELNNKAIAIAAGIPWIILMAGDATYENQDAAKAFMWNTTILPLCKKLEEAFTLYIARSYGEGLEIRFDYTDIEELLRKVQKAATASSQAIGLKLNEIRGLYPGDYAPVEKGDDLILVPGGFKNLANIGEMPDFGDGLGDNPDGEHDNGKDNEEDEEEPKKGLFRAMAEGRKLRTQKPVLETRDKERAIALARSAFRLQEYEERLIKEISKLWRKQRAEIEAYLNKQALDDDLTRIQPVRTWLDWDAEQGKFIATVKPIIKKLLIRAGADFMVGQGKAGKDGGFKYTSKISNELDKQVLKFAKNAITSTIKFLELSIQKAKQDTAKRYLRFIGYEIREDEPTKKTPRGLFWLLFGALYAIAETSASQREGETNAHWASEYGNDQGISQSGYIYKEWIDAGDERVRESHARVNGEKIPVDGHYSNGLKYPGDPAGAPEEVIGCRCTQTYSTED